MAIDILIMVGVAALLILGFVGCVVPALPGPLLSFGGVLIAHFFTDFVSFSNNQLILMGALALFVQILDQVVPVIGTKKFGGTKYGTWGSVIGLIIGLFFLPTIPPLGVFTILVGPFVGAFVGEKMGGGDNHQAMRSAVGSLLGFVAGTLMKIIIASYITIALIINLVKNAF